MFVHRFLFGLHLCLSHYYYIFDLLLARVKVFSIFRFSIIFFLFAINLLLFQIHVVFFAFSCYFPTTDSCLLICAHILNDCNKPSLLFIVSLLTWYMIIVLFLWFVFKQASNVFWCNCINCLFSNSARQSANQHWIVFKEYGVRN